MNPSQVDLAFLPHADDIIALEQERQSPEQPRNHAALERARTRLDFNPPVLLHGDFWLGNLLWNGDRPAAIIDWEDAMLGDPLADLGKSRLESLWALGPEAMQLYTEHYLRLNRQLNAATLPYWDLRGASRLSHFASFASEPRRIPRMRKQYKAFINDALKRLDAL